MAAGGQPERPAPHYFVLGDSLWYAGLAETMERVRLPLSALPPGQTSITYTHSFTAMAAGASPGPSRQPRPFDGRASHCPGTASRIPGRGSQPGARVATRKGSTGNLSSQPPISNGAPRV
jgi:hypothetical protein